jgi:multiple antibiotic resistance protein
MNFDELTIWLVIDLFVLLLIGMGPKVALVPFLDLTEGMEEDTQKKVARRMVQTAVVTALILVLLGGFLMKLLHFSPGALNIAGGIVLLLLGLHMLVSPGKDDHHEKASGRDAMKMALYPLAVPYLLNPAGISVLVISSGEADSWQMYALLVVLVLVVGALDWLLFVNISKLAKHLDPARLAVTEAVFGVLLAALAVQLMVNGMAELGIISAIIGH